MWIKHCLPIPLAVALAATNLCPGQELGSTMRLDQVLEKQRIIVRPSFVTLNLQSAPEPSPALRYRLWMPAYTLKPGSAQTHFYRALLALNEVPSDTLKRLEKWTEQGELEIPVDELPPLLRDCEVVFAELRAFSDSEDTSWDLRVRDLEATDVYQVLLPDVQLARTLARLLKHKCRAELQKQDWNAATRTLQDGFRLGSFVGQGETFVSQLVGIAIRVIMLECVTEMIQTANAPNMYWALATVPRSSVNVSEAIQFEGAITLRIFTLFEEAELKNETQEYWVSRWDEVLSSIDALYSDPKFSSQLRLAVFASTKTARDRLLSQGFSSEELAAMPPMRIVLIDTARQLRRVYDDQIKGTLLPNEVGRPLTIKASQATEQWVLENKLELTSVILLSGFSLTVQAFKDAEIREVFMLNRLMTIEAIRMHVATHDGQLPASLSELEPVPALPNAYTGEAFGYEIVTEGDTRTVVLTADAPSYLGLNETRITFSN